MPLLLKEVATTVTLPPIAFDVPDIHSRYVRIYVRCNIWHVLL